MIESMLRYSSRKRPTATQYLHILFRLLKHEYFNGVRLPDIEQTKQEVIFEQNSKGYKLDTAKEDKNIDVFRATKEKFKATRRHDAIDANPFKLAENKSGGRNQQNDNANGNDMDDLDSLIKELEEKGKKKGNKKQEKLPYIQTKDKFHKPEKKQLR